MFAYLSSLKWQLMTPRLFPLAEKGQQGADPGAGAAEEETQPADEPDPHSEDGTPEGSKQAHRPPESL